MTKAKTPTINALSDMTIDDAKPHLAALSSEQLQVLRAKEVEKGEDRARTTLLELIDGEIRKHEDADEAEGDDPNAPDPQAAPDPATLTAPIGAAPDDDPPSHHGLDHDDEHYRGKWQAAQAELASCRAVLDEIGGGLGGGAFDRDSGLRGYEVNYSTLPALIAAKLEEHRSATEQLRSAQLRIVELEQEKSLGVAPEGGPVIDRTHVALVAAPAELALRFLDRGAETLVPDVPVSPVHVHQRSGDTVIYDRQLDFPPSAPAFTLTHVALVDADGRVIDTCPIIPAMAVGGGRAVALPAGTLIFRQPAISAARLA